MIIFPCSMYSDGQFYVCRETRQPNNSLCSTSHTFSWYPSKMIKKYMCYALIFVTKFLFVQLLESGECLEGETWYEWCKKCRCYGQENYSCERHSFNCLFSAENLQNVIVFSDDRRCHYSHERKKMICVEMTYQKGVCDPGEEFMENICYKCFCTFTRFRFCKPSNLCFTRKEKPGNCPILPTFYPKPLQDLCTFERYQECYTDHGCVGPQKCCRVSDCFLRCVDPVKDNNK
ncbi:uncharacterized protein isoform X2 [Leptinotarsa decemlineata]|uniref:uncharacterized protein isoform X2 n=1 Tax=Leptinotarsa decemlineata TaxID=7539 RepID=UPI003D305BC9